jgi:integrase
MNVVKKNIQKNFQSLFSDSGLVNIDLASDSAELEMTAEERKILKEHPYEIFTSMKKGKVRWFTYLPDETDPKGRKQKQRNTEKEIKQLIIDYWKDKQGREQVPTFIRCFGDWNDHKLEIQKISKATWTRNNYAFRRYCGDIADKDMRTFTDGYLLDWLEMQVPRHEMTAKAFGNLKSLIRGVFKYARRKELTTLDIEAVLRSEDVAELKFKKVKKSDCQEVYDESETPVLIDYLINHLDSTNLCILLMTVTGLRVGEAVTLKNSDIGDIYVNVRRTQTEYRDADGNKVYGVKDFPKSEAGWRSVAVPGDYLWILDKIRRLNPFNPDGFVFLQRDGSKRINTSSVRTRLNTINKKLGIYPKSTHKLRKTYGTILLDNNVDRDFVKQQMGHSDISLTENVYHRNRKTLERKQQIVSAIPDFCRTNNAI